MVGFSFSRHLDHKRVDLEPQAAARCGTGHFAAELRAGEGVASLAGWATYR